MEEKRKEGKVDMGYVYFLKLKSSTGSFKIYVGSTDDLNRRLIQHKTQYHEGSYTSRYEVIGYSFYFQCNHIVGARQLEYWLKNYSQGMYICDLLRKNKGISKKMQGYLDQFLKDHHMTAELVYL